MPKSADRGSVATACEKLPIVAEANAENSRFAPERAFGPLHRFGNLCDRCSSFRMRFEFLDVFFRPRTAMRCRLLSRTSLTRGANRPFGRLARVDPAVPPSSRKPRPRSERPGRAVRPSALSRRVCPHASQQLCWSRPVAPRPPYALIRAMVSFHCAGDGRQAAYVNATELARETEGT